MHCASEEALEAVTSVAKHAVALRILVVCTANLCRSPMAEFLLREACSRHGLNWEITSAGTHALAGLTMHANTRRLLKERGVAVDRWTSRRLDGAMIQAADVILTATRQHRALLVNARPELLAKTYPILRFARMAEHARTTHRWCPLRDPASVLLEAVDLAEIPGGDIDDLPDPMGKSYRSFGRCAHSLDESIDRLLG